MSEKDTNNESFAELFEEYESGMTDKLNVGDKVTCTVISIGQDAVFLDVGTKTDGVADRADFLDENGELTVSEGDSVELYVVILKPGEIRLSKAVSGIGGLHLLEEAKDNGLPVEGKVTGTCKGGFNVDVLRKRAFCPVSQIDTAYVEDPEQYVGQSFQFLIIKLEQRGRNIVVSRRSLLERERQESLKALLAETNAGDEVTGKITRLAPFGAFMEIAPGLEGMIHVSELSWARVDEPSEAVNPGDTVTATILKIEDGKREGEKRISLSIKSSMQNPWDTVTDTFEAGQKVTGTISRIAPFGAFVEIAPGVDGLIHLSEMSYEKRVVKADDIVKPGQQVSVVIKDINPEKRRISLSLKDAAGDPWLEAEEKFPSGQTVTGTVEKREAFGIFINLAPGITGLLPKSNIARSENAKAFDDLKPGDSVEITVENVNQSDRRISLAPTDARQGDDWKSAPRKGGKGNRGPAKATFGDSGGMGLLGQKLQEAMKEK